MMEDLINNAHLLFQQSGSGSPPLPAAPLNEPAAPITYGSTHTKVSSMPPPPVPSSPRKLGHHKTPSLSTPRSSIDAPRSILQGPQDFTPQLPPRPTNSIHPSLRAGPHANSPARQPPSIRAGQFFDDQVRVPPPPQSPVPSQQSYTNGSSSSLPPPLPPRVGEEPSISTASLSSSLTSSTSPSSGTAIESFSHSREPSSKRSSRQIPPSDLPQVQEETTDTAPAPSDLFSTLQSSPGHSHDSGLELSSTAAAAAFASATPSPTPSSHSGHSGQSSPSKRKGLD